MSTFITNVSIPSLSFPCQKNLFYANSLITSDSSTEKASNYFLHSKYLITFSFALALLNSALFRILYISLSFRNY